MAKKKATKKQEIVVDKIDKEIFAASPVLPDVPYDSPLVSALEAYIRENKLPAYNVQSNIAELSDGFLVASYKD